MTSTNNTNFKKETIKEISRKYFQIRNIETRIKQIECVREWDSVFQAPTRYIVLQVEKHQLLKEIHELEAKIGECSYSRIRELESDLNSWLRVKGVQEQEETREKLAEIRGGC